MDAAREFRNTWHSPEHAPVKIPADSDLALVDFGPEPEVPAIDQAMPVKRRRRSTRRVMSDARRERLRLIIYLYRSGVTASDIGVAIGRSKQRVLQILAHAGVERRKVGPIRTKAIRRQRIADITALYDMGLSLTEIAHRLGFTRHYIRELVTEAAIDLRATDDRRLRLSPEYTRTRRPNSPAPEAEHGA